MDDVTDEMVDAAWEEAYRQNIQRPFAARVHDYPNVALLQAVDRQCEEKNNEAMRKVLKAALAKNQ